MVHTSKGKGLPGWRTLTAGDAEWPPLWRQLPDPPAEVMVSGLSGVLTKRAVAIVGTRRPSHRGTLVAERLATVLVRRGWVVVSGLARGIDSAAHRGALSGGGETVAVVGTGLDLTYPPEHEPLRRRIETAGCVVTEFPVGAPPLRHHFPLRNRLIAGLSEGVIVIDAPLRSGALLTAYLALDLNREVFAVPGPIDSPLSRGCHHLVKEGAALMDSVQDIDRILPPPRLVLEPTPSGFTDRITSLPLPAPGSAARWIFDRVGLDPLDLDELRNRWPGTGPAWSEGLLALERAGLIRRLPGRRLARNILFP